MKKVLVVLLLTLMLAASACASQEPAAHEQETPSSDAAAQEPVEPRGPSGTIAYMVDSEVRTIGVDGQGAKKVYDIPMNNWGWHATTEKLAPVGMGKYYVFDRNEYQGAGFATAVFVDVTTGNATAVENVRATTRVGDFDATGAACYLSGWTDGYGTKGTPRVLRFDTATGVCTPIGPELTGGSHVVVSPDGARLACLTGEGLLVMNSDGSNVVMEANVQELPLFFTGDTSKLILDGPFSVDVAPNNTLSNKQTWDGPVGRLVNGVLRTWTLDGTVKTYLPDGAGFTEVGDFTSALSGFNLDFNYGTYESGLSPSPDGRYLVLSSDKNGSFDLYLVGLDGTEIQLTNDLGDEMYPEWLN